MWKKIILTIGFFIGAYFLILSTNTKKIDIDKIYVINLDRSPKRLEHMKNTLDPLGLPVKFEKFKAIDGRDLFFTNVDTNITLKGQEVYEKQIWLRKHFKIDCSAEDSITLNIDQTEYNPRVTGDAGAICSHRAVWIDAVKNGYKNTLIFEDDIKAVPGFKNRFERVLSYVPKDYELLYFNMTNLGGTFRSESEYLKPLMNFYELHARNIFWRQARKNFGGAKSYVVTPEGAKKLLACDLWKSPTETTYPVDYLISKCVEKDKIITYTTNPDLFLGNDDIPSDIATE